MKLQVFSVYDQKSEAYFTPFMEQNDAIALRKMSFAINDYRSDVSKCPEDYTLFKLAEFDDSTGEYTLAKKSLGNGVEFVDAALAEKFNKIQLPEFDGSN